jgi:hypothetical protein
MNTYRDKPLLFHKKQEVFFFNDYPRMYHFLECFKRSIRLIASKHQNIVSDVFLNAKCWWNCLETTERRSFARRLSFAEQGHLLAEGVWVHLSSEISETTERIQLIRVPEPASQVLLSVVSDISDDIFSRNFPPCIFDENVGFTSALFAYPRKKSLKPAWLCIRFARHLDQSPFSAAAQHSSNKFDFAFALHENPYDINSPEIHGKWGTERQRGSVPTIFKGGTFGDNHIFFCAGWLHRQVGTLHDRDKRQKNDGGDNRNGISLPRW